MRFTLLHVALAVWCPAATRGFALGPRPHSATRTAVVRQSLADFEERARALTFSTAGSSNGASTRPLEALAASSTEALQHAQQAVVEAIAQLTQNFPATGAVSGSGVEGLADLAATDGATLHLQEALQAWVHASVDWAAAVPPAVPVALCLAVCVDALLLNGALRNGLFSPASRSGVARGVTQVAGRPAWVSGSAWARGQPEPNPYTTNGRYNPSDAAVYFATRPAMVASRAASIAVRSSGFGLALLLDHLQVNRR
jgi:hypothetical protein